MKSEKLIHIKFEYESAIECKKDILATEIDLLKISKRVQGYKESRMLELDIKTKINKKMRALKLDIGRLQNLLPEVQIPKLLKPTKKKESPKEMHEEPIIREEHSEMSSVDSELLEIQRKLKALQA